MSVRRAGELLTDRGIGRQADVFEVERVREGNRLVMRQRMVGPA
ncbi:hypothetical protein GGD41_002968 [Paraburkholderia bryophila]|uniref:Uncharacterized protein n=1 Tax=Paraburkholderia bryophila TaxID=420952 RepID=A0A7Z0B0M1_9BURK|nr:hypothetical protein [Paraburkholderia bryophila]